MRSTARIVVVGGGIMGASLLYHLAEEGCSDALLLEKDDLTCGSTWHAAGQCPSITGSYNLAKIHAYGNRLYPQLEALTGQYVGWHPCGGLRLATNERELEWLRRVLGFARNIGFGMEIVGVDEIRRLNPFLDTTGVIAAAHTTDDGHGDPSGLCRALAKGARDRGSAIERHCRVLAIRALPSGEWEVETTQGRVTAEMVVNAAGCYAREVARMVGADAPIVNMQHHYVVTHPVPAFQERTVEIPVVRDPYARGYLRQEQKSGLIGVYEHDGIVEAWAPRGVPDWASREELFPEDLERIAPWLERALERMPIFAEAGIRRVINGAIPHTPDGAPLLGPAAGRRNFWMCCGTSFGIAQGAGCGKYLAQWMLHGDSEINMAEFDPRRFGGYADAGYARAKVFLDYRTTFVTRAPGEEDPDGRPQRTSPLYERLRTAGAVCGEIHGWERPLWFALDGRTEQYSYRRNNVFEVVAAETRALHERVGFVDTSAFAKFEITGADAAAYLDRVLANRLPRREGGIVLTHALSPNGRIAAEVTLTRLAPDRFYAVGASASQLRDADLLRDRVRPGERVAIDDVTEALGALLVAGPRAREVLAAHSAADLSNQAFPWLSARSIEVAGIPVRALRVSYVGELGWELHAPRDALGTIYDALYGTARAMGGANVGLHAVNGMRLEKAYRGFGTELTNELTLPEAGMTRFFAPDKGEFVGRAATLAAPERGLRIVYLEVDARDIDARGGEPVFDGDRCVGLVTSGGYGHRVGRSLAFACVEPASAGAEHALTLLLQNERVGATVRAAPAFDPSDSRSRA